MKKMKKLTHGRKTTGEHQNGSKSRTKRPGGDSTPAYPTPSGTQDGSRNAKNNPAVRNDPEQR